MFNDLSAIDTTKACNDGAEIELVHPTTKEPLGQFIRVVGKDGDDFRNQVANNANDERRKAFLAARRGKVAEMETFEQSQDKGREILVSCTTGFRCNPVLNKDKTVKEEGGPFLRFNGKLEFTPANARMLYTERVWVRTQVDEAIVDLENFMKS